MNWFKLVGATDDLLADDWEHDEPHNFEEIHFPWNKPPEMFSSSDRVILYAVGSTTLIATQSVDGLPGINPRRGPKGSRSDRWPHDVKVKTHHYCSPLSTAPRLRDVAPDFAEKYAKLFRNGSHWRIDDKEYDQLAAAIESAGRPYAGT